MSNEQTKYEEITHDDKGVLCGYTEEEGWVALEECCEECGCTDCECEEELEFGCKYCRGYFDNGDNYCRSCNFDLNCYNEPEEEELCGRRFKNGDICQEVRNKNYEYCSECMEIEVGMYNEDETY